jgi:dUTP pyrophosphatase
MPCDFFQNKDCEYFPCHPMILDGEVPQKFSCLFCFCPLYNRKDCGGAYDILPNGMKDCSRCRIPHFRYDYIIKKLTEEPTMIDINSSTKTIIARDMENAMTSGIHEVSAIIEQAEEEGRPLDEVMDENGWEKIDDSETYELEENDLLFAKLKPEAIIPTKRNEDAGYDIYPCFKEDFIRIQPLETKFIPTGFAFACHPSRYIQIEERGSTGTKGIKKSAGVFDSGFRNEFMIVLYNGSTKPVIIAKEEAYNHFTYVQEKLGVEIGTIYPYEKAIAQGVVHTVPQMITKVVDYDTLMKYSSERGLGKLGSSGK